MPVCLLLTSNSFIENKNVLSTHLVPDRAVWFSRCQGEQVDKTGQNRSESRMIGEQADGKHRDKADQTVTENDLIPKQTSEVADTGSLCQSAER